MANTYTLPGVLLSGTHAGRPAASTVASGTIYGETDTGNFYQSNASSWSAWGPATIANPMTTSQDTIVGGASGSPGRLAVGAAGAALSVINSAVAWNSGTSFPGSKATGDRYWRTDLGLECYWDGTRWLTVELFTENMGVGNTVAPDAAGTAHGRMPLFGTAYDFWIVYWDAVTYVATTNDGSHFWTISLNKNIANDTGSAIDSFTTAADTVNVWTNRHRSIGASVVAATYFNLNITAAKTSTPGGIYFAYRVSYRLIVT